MTFACQLVAECFGGLMLWLGAISDAHFNPTVALSEAPAMLEKIVIKREMDNIGHYGNKD